MGQKAGATADDARWMRMALALAARGLGRVGLNPTVGAVVVRDGRVLGRGVTGAGGRPHAETIALAQARERYGDEALRGATAYVTLEPCAHHGRTPPCAEALIAAGIGRVVCPLTDPDPRVSGRGFAAMTAAGIAVETGILETEAQGLNAGFLSRIARGRPYLTLKLAATLDGRIATRAGESRWITGAEARARVHLMRLQSDAVLVGAGTARADDPMLDVRGFGPGAAQPMRVVADGGLAMPVSSRLAASAHGIPVTVLCRANAPAKRRSSLERCGVTVIEVAAGPEGRLDMADALAKLGAAEVNRVLCEGGRQLAGALIAAGLVDELALFTAGKVIGGDGIAGVADLELDSLALAPGFTLARVERVGGDVLSVWHAAARAAAAQ